MFARLLIALIWFWCTSAFADDKIDITIGYLERIVPSPPVLSNLEPIPEDEGLAGATLAIRDNATTGKFLGHNYTLQTQVVSENGDIVAVAKELLSTIKLVILNAPKADLLTIADLPEARDAILFNAAEPGTSLRDEACRTNLLHTLPSRAMLADALLQFAVKKKWSKLVLIEGSRPGDTAFAEALADSAAKFSVDIAARKTWAFDADMRRSAASELPLFTQDFPDHDLLLVADAADDFARYIPYHTWIPRPVAGSEGLVPSAWSANVEQHGAAQLQSRFRESAGRAMRPIDYAAWTAIRSIGETVTRTASAKPSKLRAYLLGSDFELGAFKGRKLTYRSWNGQLRQPIVLSHPRAVVALAPLEGFLHQRNELDTLGLDKPESKCEAFGE